MRTLSTFRLNTALPVLALALAIGTSAAHAQAPAPSTPAPAAAADADAADEQTVVVTGSLLRTRTTPSPVTVVNAEALDQRGISTIQEGIQRLAANNGPALTNSFSANGAFAGGASAVSLRGLSSNSTLVLFDGMRAAFYPLADDGTRNFVDLNTVPDDIVQEIQTLKDGASATYGADAIAGVVNIITKKNIQGVTARGEAGISGRGDASQYRASVTAGIGDLQEKGFNAYISGFYYKQEQLFNRQRPYPYSTGDFSRLNDTAPGFNNVVNGLQADGFTGGFGLGTPFAVRPRSPTAVGPGTGRYQLLAGCQGLPSYNPTAAELALTQNASASTTVCQDDRVNRFGVISPDIERFGLSARITARVGDSGEAFAAFNFINTEVMSDGANATIRANAPAPFFFPRYSTSGNIPFYGNNTVLQLPVYVCPRGGTPVACTAANGRLNPNNPFAAAGQNAELGGFIPNLFEHDESRTRGYRGALGIRGPISENWDYNVQGTAMHIDLRRKSDGYVYIQNLLNVIADGSYNFLNPAANSQATLDYIAPTARATSTSDLVQGDASVTGRLFDLPGGPLQLAAGVQVRYEAVDSPSINSDVNGATQRYFRLNGFALKGSRTIYSGYAELNAPIIDAVTVNAAGRYDKYPDGIDNFSPKVGLVVRPIRQVALRGTFSRGFRIPSFGEINATFPTTGFVNATQSIYGDAFLRQYGCTLATYTSCPAYVRSASYGATSISNPDLKPEKSRNFTGGIVLTPLTGVRLEAGYYNIRKTNVITTANNGPALLAYYNAQAIPAGYGIVQDAVDPNFPNATPRVAFVQSPFINANTQKTSGLDFGAAINLPLTERLRLTVNGDASYILKLETVFPDGSVERYDGTLGNFNLTAGSGTPKWKGVLSTTLEFADRYMLSGTVNYISGYDLSAMDQGTGYKDCGLADGSIPCHVSDYATLDLTGQVKISDRLTLYGTIQNVLNDLPPIDTVTYGANGYNPVQGGEGIFGRYFKAGFKVGL